MTEDTKKTEPALTAEESAFFIRTTWEALISPTWNKDDIIEFGKAVFAQTKLNSMNDALFARLLPYLKQISQVMGAKILAQAEKAKPVEAARPSPAPKPEANHG